MHTAVAASAAWAKVTPRTYRAIARWRTLEPGAKITVGDVVLAAFLANVAAGGSLEPMPARAHCAIAAVGTSVADARLRVATDVFDTGH